MDEADKFNLMVDLEMFDAYRLKKVKDFVEQLKLEKESPKRPWISDARFKNCVRNMHDVVKVYKIDVPTSVVIEAEISFDENDKPNVLSYSGFNWEEVSKQIEKSDETKAYGTLVKEKRKTINRYIAELSAEYNVTTEEIAAEISFEMDF